VANVSTYSVHLGGFPLLKTFKKEHGFTLIEMLIVLLIISVLIILIIPNLTGKGKAVQSKGCDALKSMVQSQIVSFELAEGRLPSSLDELETKGYIEKGQKSCPNKAALGYDAASGKVTAGTAP